jgi:hypothetical protein
MEHPPLVPTLSPTLPRNRELSHSSWDQVAPAALGTRLRTGCVYDAQLPDTFGLLVTRTDPRTRRSRPRPLAAIQAHWPLFAPSLLLLTGHETACRSRRCHGMGRYDGHAPQHLGWPAFAAAYRAELEAWPCHTRLAIAQQIAAWLHTAPTVTILSFEHRTPAESTPRVLGAAACLSRLAVQSPAAGRAAGCSAAAGCRRSCIGGALSEDA